MFKRDQIISNIVNKLTWLTTQVKVYGSLNLHDINIHAEYFFRDFLNTVFGYSLENLNTLEKNYSAIDLGDKKNRLAIQVTSETARDKIQSTIDLFLNKSFDAEYDRLVVLIIGEKRNYRKGFDTKGRIEFSEKNDIWDIKFLTQAINGKTMDGLVSINSFLDSQLTVADGYRGTSLRGMVETVLKSANALCLAKLCASGIDRDIARQIIDDDVASAKFQYILEGMSTGKYILIGEFGSGKSHAILILIQQLAKLFLDNEKTVVPLFVLARDIKNSGSLSHWLDSHNARSKYILFIDGLDEVEYTFAKQLVEDVRYLLELTPENHIIIGSRPLSFLTNSTATLHIAPMSFPERCALYEILTGDSNANLAFNHLDSNWNETLEKPFFCIVYSLFNSRPKAWAKTEMDLVTALVDRALQDNQADAKELQKDLESIAAKTIDRNLGTVHISEIKIESSLNDLLKTGFLLQSEENICFSLPIVAQWMAAAAIRDGIVSIEAILADRIKINRWMYPLSILFSQMTFTESMELFSKIVITLPGVASRIIRDGVRFKSSPTLPTPLDCGIIMRRCMQDWVNGLGSLSEFIAPIDSAGVLPLVINIEGNGISYSWDKKRNTDSVSVMPYDDILHLCGSVHRRSVSGQSTWPWIITFEHLSDELKRVINEHCVIVPGQLADEYLWDALLCIKGKGSLYEKHIDLLSIKRPRDYCGKVLKTRRRNVSLNLFFQILDEHIAAGNTMMEPPYPTSDKSRQSGGLVWSSYSSERYLERVRFVYNNALQQYKALTDTVFSALKRDLKKSQLIPCKLVGGLRFNEDPKNAYDAPDMTWYLEALPITEESYTDIQLRDIPINDETIWKNMVENNARYRPDLAESQQGFITSQVLNVISTTPVTNVVYSWLKDDLNEIGWLE